MDFFVFTDYFTDYLRECKLKITEKRNKFHFVILENKRFHISSANKVSFEWSQSRILSADSDGRIHLMLRHLIQGVEAKGVKWNR